MERTKTKTHEEEMNPKEGRNDIKKCKKCGEDCYGTNCRECYLKNKRFYSSKSRYEHSKHTRKK